MTSVNLYKTLLDAHCISLNNELNSTLGKYKPSFIARDNNDVVGYIQDYDKLKKDYTRFIMETRPSVMIDFAKCIREEFSGEVKEYRKELMQLELKYNEQLKDLKNNKLKTIKDIENEIQKYEQKYKKSMEPVIKKHRQLEVFKDELLTIFHIYNLSNDYVLDTDNLTKEELEDLIELSHYTMTKIVKNKNSIGNITKLLYAPLDMSIESKDVRLVSSIAHLLVVLAVLFLTKPFGMGVIGLLYLINIFGNLRNIKIKEEFLQICYAMTADLDFTKFIKSEEEYMELLNKLETTRNMSTIDTEKTINDKRNKDKENYEEAHNPEKRIQEELDKYKNDITIVDKKLNELKIEIERDFKSKNDSFEYAVSRYENHFKLLKESLTQLGQVSSNNLTLNTNFAVATTLFRKEPILDYVMDVPLNGIIFQYNDIYESRNDQIKFMKILLLNALLNVRPGQLKVTIYDEQKLGREFVEFMNSNTNDIITIKTNGLDELLNENITETKKVMRKLGTKHIQNFNETSASIGKVTIPYNLIIIVSTAGDVHANIILKKYMEYAGEMGTLIWILDKNPRMLEKEEDKERAVKFLVDLALCESPYSINYNNKILSIPKHPVVPYVYSEELISNGMAVYTKSLLDGVVDIIMYERDYRSKFIPSNKIWRYSTLDGIEIRFGLEDGDPTKPGSIILGDKNVHALMGGTTGAGKSVTIDTILASVLNMYSPEELELVMVDFKNVEFKKYTEKYAIPHAKICAGTKDGEYAVSIFEYLVGEMKRRQRLCGKYQLQNTRDFNKRVLSGEISEEYLPRILALFDEFQVMFTDVDDRSLDLINKHIVSLAKLARAFGLHFLFTSQSMEGTLKDDIMDQFSLRAALRCSKEVSKNLIGSDVSANLPKFGFVHTNDSGGQRVEATKLWRTPFLPIDDIKQYITRLRDKGLKENNLDRKAKFYDEEFIHEQTDLVKWYASTEVAKDDYAILLGERTSYAVSPLPNSFRFVRQDGENLICSAFERSSLLNIINTFMYNINNKSSATLCVHSADADTTSLLDLENRVDSQFKPFIDSRLTGDELLTALEELIIFRQENEYVEPLYFLGIYWEKLVGLGRDEDYDLQDRFTRILQEGPIVDVHILLFLKDTKKYYQYISMFNHRICSYTTETDSFNLLDNSKANNNNYCNKNLAIYLYGSDSVKFKIYNFKTFGKIESRTFGG